MTEQFGLRGAERLAPAEAIQRQLTIAGGVHRTRQVPQHVEQRDKNGELQQHRQAAGQRIEALLALQLLHGLRLGLPVALVLFLDLRDLGLKRLHMSGVMHLFYEELDEQQPSGDDQEHDRQRPGSAALGIHEQREELVPAKQHPGHRGVKDVGDRADEAHVEGSDFQAAGAAAARL